MGMTQIGDKVDAGVADVSERFLRKMTRRSALRNSLLGGVVTVAGLAVGEGVAKGCVTESGCSCGPTVRCGTYGHSCPSDGCPSGMDICKNGSSYYCSCNQGHYNVQGYCCEYACGYWITCTGLCKGYGFRICYDCHGGGLGCSHWCTCLSEILCCQCTSAKDFHKEQARIQAKLGT
jgi:hypothetical protein